MTELIQNRDLGRQLIDDDEFNRRLQAFIGWARKVMHGRDALAPHLFVLSRSKDGFDMIVVVLDVDLDVETKYQTLLNTGIRVARENPDLQPAVVFMVSEAWVSRQMDTLPADAPDRQEVVLVSGVTIDGRSNMATITIRRTGANAMHPGRVSLMPYSAENSDILGSSQPNKLIMAFLQGLVLSWLSRYQAKKSNLN